MDEGDRATGLRVPPDNAGRPTRTEEAIDEVLAESFPASDAPPWTLGVERQSVYVDVAGEPQ